MIHSFDCPRTCPFVNEKFCRFMPIFEELGVETEVNSTTVTVETKIKDLQTLTDVVNSMEGKVLGKGKHKLFDRSVEGFAVQLKNWRYPIIITEDGKMHFDDYNGSWGKRSDLDTLTKEYMMAKAMKAAKRAGYSVQRKGEELYIYHPSGGYMVMRGDNLEAVNFTGNECHKAIEPIVNELGGITAAIPRQGFKKQQNLNQTS